MGGVLCVLCMYVYHPAASTRCARTFIATRTTVNCQAHTSKAKRKVFKNSAHSLLTESSQSSHLLLRWVKKVERCMIKINLHHEAADERIFL